MHWRRLSGLTGCGRYCIDFEDFEQKIISSDVKVFILCSPHNPVSRVWSAEEPEELQPFMQDRCRLAFDYGSWFGGDKSGSFIRINLATSRENIEDMAARIIRELE